MSSRHMIGAGAWMCGCLALVGLVGAAGAAQADEAKKPDVSRLYTKKATWQQTMRASRRALGQLDDQDKREAAGQEISALIRRDFPDAMRVLARQRYWWLDEIRAVARSLSRATTGKVARWPRMTVPAGSGTLPLPRAAGAMKADGRLVETAWQRATSFPVGPIFAAWREGPFMLRVSACRDAEHLYLVVRSPRDLTGLGSPGDQTLFHAAGRSYRIDGDGKLPGGVARRWESGHVVELAVPLPKDDKPIELSFPVELIRCLDGVISPELTNPWLRGRGRTPTWPVWLNAIRVQLVAADVGVWFSNSLNGPASGQVLWRFRPAATANARGEIPLEADADGVMPYAWTGKWNDKQFALSGFVYVEPIAATLAAARDIVRRAASIRATSPAGEDLHARIDAASAELRTASRTHRVAWRALYCRARALRASAHLSMLDAPLLFVKRHPYFAWHIYDDYYTWHPGGGIYVIENPAAPLDERRIRSVIDPDTDLTLGEGVYRDPDVSRDARRVAFAHKGEDKGDTSIYEIGIDGGGLRRLSDPACGCTTKPAVRAMGSGRHDIGPAYLPDGRIVFTSTRLAGRVPCFNSEVDVLHVMNWDGTDVRSISVNNVNEFDPAVLPDGRILFGRWEYVDKTALYMQSLWTIFPDGTNETALFANNLARPTAVLDARPVPGTELIVAALTPHNGQAAGAIAMINPRLGKNNLAAITNFTPEYPAEMDQGLATGPCDPWPLLTDDLLFSNNALGGHAVLELADRAGHRELVHADPEISCYSPMLIKQPRPVPPVIAPLVRHGEPGRFLVHDVYRGLSGVKRGEVKRLRVIEETTRISGIPGGGRWWNQAFLVSWQGAYVVKNILGVVPVYEDGSAYLEVPAGRALYFEVLDAEGREIQRMRTFVQAAPGVTRSCIGCHEDKTTTPRNGTPNTAQHRPPARPEPESWGSGFIDYPTMIQPILDRHCVRCHGGEEDVAGGIDLSGGWTWAFNISYETLIKNTLAGFMRCRNDDVTSSVILPPRTIGSAVAPLAKLLVDGHEGRIPKLSRKERDLVMAWMDTNCNYYGTWNWTEHATCDAIFQAGNALADVMKQAGCVRCHEGRVGNDWINLREPKYSRILRAPLARGEEGFGLGWCRDRKAGKGLPLVDQRAQPPDVFRPSNAPKPNPSGQAVVTFASTDDEHYQAMLAIVRQTRQRALSRPRVDMPGVTINPGDIRQLVPTPLPKTIPALNAKTDDEGVVELSWRRSAETIGLMFELHRGDRPDFAPCEQTLLSTTTLFRHEDLQAPAGRQYYALVAVSDGRRSQPVRAAVVVPPSTPPRAPTGLAATARPGEVALGWDPAEKSSLRFNVYRAEDGSSKVEKLNEEPFLGEAYVDVGPAAGVRYRYVVRWVTRRGLESAVSPPAVAAALPERKEPVFAVRFDRQVNARLMDDIALEAKTHGNAKAADGTLDLRAGGHVTFPHKGEFDLASRLSVECWVYLDQAGQSPVVVSCGQWNGTGWFIQKLGNVWRWHLGGVDCDGGKPEVGRWIHLVATFDGRQAGLYQNGVQVASKSCSPNLAPYTGVLAIGQYSPAPEARYQVTGRIAAVNIYRRVVTEKEAEAMFKAGKHQGRVGTQHW